MAKRYQYCWRGRFVGEDAETVAELVTALREAAADLEEMAKAGVTFDSSDGDYVFLVTEDRKVAERFGFEPE